jgi:hypothetical protein
VIAGVTSGLVVEIVRTAIVSRVMVETDVFPGASMNSNSISS